MWSLNLFNLKRVSLLKFKTTCETCLNDPQWTKLFSTTSKRSKSFKVLFFGTDEFALETLKRLEMRNGGKLIHRLEVCCAKSSTTVSPVAKFSTEKKLNLHSWPPNIKEAEFDLGVVASFGHLIPSKIIEKFPHGILNVHGSLLPQLRGAAPIIHALKNGLTETGVTIMKIKPKKFDIGDIFCCDTVRIGKHETRPQLTHRMAVLGGDLLVKVLEDYEKYERRALPQDDVGVSYAPAVNKSYAFIDFNKQSGDEIYNLWRGIGDIIKLRARWKPTNTTTRFAVCIPPEEIQDLDLDSKYPNTPPGVAVFVKAGKGRSYLCISCLSGWVALTGIYYGGRKKMEARDFANGFIHPGAEHLFIKDS